MGSVGWLSVTSYGAVGDGNTDDTAAVAAAFSAAHAAGQSGSPGNSGAAVYFPAGQYVITAFPALWNYDVIIGDGSDVSEIIFQNSGALVSISGLQRVRFQNLGFWITGTGGSGFHLSNSFRCSFDSVVIRGQYVGPTGSSNYTTYKNTVGVTLDRNTGGTSFVDCDITNFGTGLSTACIQNYVTNCRFTSNYTSVLGTSDPNNPGPNAGLAIVNSEFVGSDSGNTVDTNNHILVNAAANDWWITNTWFEGAVNAIVVGAAGVGGPSQFGMTNCKVSSQQTCIQLQYCRQPSLTNVIFDSDPGHTPTELQINATNCPQGVATGLISDINTDIAQTAFPGNWIVLARQTAYFNAPVYLCNTTTSNQNVLTVQNNAHSTEAAILSDGAFLSNNAAAGYIFKSPNGTYWRATISNTGAITTTNLGATLPTS